MLNDHFIYSWGKEFTTPIIGLCDVVKVTRIRTEGYSVRYFEFSKVYGTHEIKRKWLEARHCEFRIATAARVFCRPLREVSKNMPEQWYNIHFEVIDGGHYTEDAIYDCKGLKTEVWKYPFALSEIPELHNAFRCAFSERPSLDWDICLPTVS